MKIYVNFNVDFPNYYFENKIKQKLNKIVTNDVLLRLSIKSLLLETFEKIYTDNYEAMFRVARKMVYDVDVVSDIVQEVFIYFFDKVNRGDEVRYPKSWLYRATYNKCIDYWRDKKRFVALDQLDSCEIEEQNIDHSEMKAVLNRAIDKLKPQEKFLIVLYSEGLSYKEIAEVTDMKFSSVGKTLSRILTKIEKKLIYQYDELYN